jgi:hypothetical protein
MSVEKLNLLFPNLPRVSFSRFKPRSLEESADRGVIWGVNSIKTLIEEADRRLGLVPTAKKKEEEG